MEEEKCDSCDTALTEENKCSCEPSKCKECCTCPDDCDCGCKGGEKKDAAETSEGENAEAGETEEVAADDAETTEPVSDDVKEDDKDGE